MSRGTTTHGMTHSTEFAIWNGARQRCRDPHSKDYPRYGGRGITVCEEWLHDFPAFLRDMGMRPSHDHSLDRIDNDGPYSKANCRWVTRHVQSNNRRNTRFLTLGDLTLPIVDWSRATGISAMAIRARLRAGWSMERALTCTIREGVRLRFRGKTRTLAEWAHRLGTSRRTIGERLRRGWSVNRTLTTPIRAPHR